MYNFIMKFVRFLLLILNGRTKVIGKENLPTDEKFVLVAPHRSFLDPVYIAITALPHHFAFMAKKELFDIPFLGWLITKLNAFPVDREKPGLSVVKIPVNYLKKNELNVLVFPSGSRHSTELKGGAVTIARMGKSNIVPAIYDGPLTVKDLLLRKKTTVIFGKPIIIERKIEGVKDINAYYSDKIQDAFDFLEQKN